MVPESKELLKHKQKKTHNNTDVSKGHISHLKVLPKAKVEIL